MARSQQRNTKGGQSNIASPPGGDAGTPRKSRPVEKATATATAKGKLSKSRASNAKEKLAEARRVADENAKAMQLRKDEEEKKQRQKEEAAAAQEAAKRQAWLAAKAKFQAESKKAAEQEAAAKETADESMTEAQPTGLSTGSKVDLTNDDDDEDDDTGLGRLTNDVGTPPRRGNSPAKSDTVTQWFDNLRLNNDDLPPDKSTFVQVKCDVPYGTAPTDCANLLPVVTAIVVDAVVRVDNDYGNGKLMGLAWRRLAATQTAVTRASSEVSAHYERQG